MLTMKGGAKGLLQNSRDLCEAPRRATAKFDAHNGRLADLRPKLDNSCGKGMHESQKRPLPRAKTAG